MTPVVDPNQARELFVRRDDAQGFYIVSVNIGGALVPIDALKISFVDDLLDAAETAAAEQAAATPASLEPAAAPTEAPAPAASEPATPATTPTTSTTTEPPPAETPAPPPGPTETAS